MRIDGATPGVDAGSSVDEAELQRQQAEAEAARAAAEAARVRAEIDAQTGLDGSNAFVGTAGATGGAVREEPELPSTPTGFDVGSLYAPSVHSQAPILDPPAPPPEVDARGSQPPANDAPTNDVPRTNDAPTNNVPTNDVPRTNDVPTNSVPTNDVPRTNDVPTNDVPRTNDVPTNDVPRANDVPTNDVPRTDDPPAVDEPPPSDGAHTNDVAGSPPPALDDIDLPTVTIHARNTPNDPGATVPEDPPLDPTVPEGGAPSTPPTPPSPPSPPATTPPAAPSPHEHQIAINRATRELSEGALTFDGLEQLVQNGTFTREEADKIRNDGVNRWKDQQAREFVAGLGDGTKSADELKEYVRLGHFTQQQADAISGRVQQEREAKAQREADELARRVSTGEVSFAELDRRVADGSLTRAQADAARDQGAARWKKEREAEFVERLSRGELSDDEIAGYVKDGHFTTQDIARFREQGAARATERREGALVEQLATGAMSQQQLKDAVAAGSISQADADRLLARATDVWKGRRDDALVDEVASGAVSQEALRAKVEAGELTQAEADKILSRASDKWGAARDAALAEQVSRGEVSFEDLDKMVADGKLTREEADKIRDQGASLWQGRTAQEMVDKLARGEASHADLMRLVDEGHLTREQADAVSRAAGEVWRESEANALVGRVARGEVTDAELAQYVKDGHFTQEQIDALKNAGTDIKNADRNNQIVEQLATGAMSQEQLADKVASGELTQREADMLLDAASDVWKGRRNLEIAERVSRGEVSHAELDAMVERGELSRAEADGIRETGGEMWRDRTAGELIDRVSRGEVTDEELAQYVADGHFTQEQIDALKNAGTDIKNAERNEKLVEELATGALSHEALDAMVASGELTQREADMLREAATDVWKGRRDLEIAEKVSRGEVSHEELDAMVERGELSRDEADRIREAGGQIWRERTAEDLVDRMTRGEVTDEELAQLVADGHFTDEQIGKLKGIADDIQRDGRATALAGEVADGKLTDADLDAMVERGELSADEAAKVRARAQQTKEDDALLAKLRSGELSQDDFTKMIESGVLSPADVQRIIARDQKTAGAAAATGAQGESVVAPLTEADVSALSSGYKAQRQMLWSEQAIELTRQRSFEQGLISQEKTNENQALAHDVILGKDRSADPSSPAHQIDAGSLAAIARQSGIAIERVDVSQLSSALPYINGAKTKEEQAERLKNVLDQLYLVDAGKKPQFTHTDVKGMAWDLARIGGHAVDNVKNPNDIQKLFDDLAAKGNTPGDHKLKVGKHEVKFTINGDNEYIDGSGSTKSTGGFLKTLGKIGQIALTAASFVPGIGVIATVANAAISTIKAAKNGNILGAIAGAAGAFAGGIAGLVGNKANLLSRIGDTFSAATRSTLNTIGRFADLASKGIKAGQAIASGNVLQMATGAADALGLAGNFTNNKGWQDALNRAGNLASSGVKVGGAIATRDIAGAIAGGLSFSSLVSAGGNNVARDRQTSLQGTLGQMSQLARLGGNVADAIHDRSLAGLISAGFNVAGYAAGQGGHDKRGELVTHLGSFANGVISNARTGDVWGAINAGVAGIGQLRADRNAVVAENATIRQRQEAERARQAAAAAAAAGGSRELSAEERAFLAGAQGNVAALEKLMGEPRVVGGLAALAQSGVTGLKSAATELEAALKGGDQAAIDAAMARFNAAQEQAKNVYSALTPLAGKMPEWRSTIATPSSLVLSEGARLTAPITNERELAQYLQANGIDAQQLAQLNPSLFTRGANGAVSIDYSKLGAGAELRIPAVRETFQYTVPASDARQPEKIMAAFRTSPAEFARLNPHLVRADGSLDENALRAGALVNLPFATKDPEGADAFARGFAASTTVRISGRYTIEQLAVLNGLTTREVLAANPGLDPTRLKVGDEIRLPLRTADEAAATRFREGVLATQAVRAAERAMAADLTAGKAYEVRSGDTLAAIAARNGVTVDQLRQANPSIPADGRLMTTQKIVIPGAENFVKLPDGQTAYVRPSELQQMRGAALSAATKNIDSMLTRLEEEARRQQGSGTVGTAVADAATQFASWVMSGFSRSEQDSIKNFQGDNAQNVAFLRRKFEEAKAANGGVVDENWVRTFLGTQAWGPTPPPGVKMPPLPPGVPAGTQFDGLLQNAAARLGDTASYRQAQVDLTRDTLLQIGVTIATAGYGSVVGGVGSRAAVTAGTAGRTWVQAGLAVGTGAGVGNAALGVAFEDGAWTVGGVAQNFASGFATGFSASAFNGALTSNLVGVGTGGRIGREIAEGFLGDVFGNAADAAAQGRTWFGPNGFDFAGGLGRVGAAGVSDLTDAVQSAQNGNWLGAIGSVALGPAMTAGVHLASSGRLGSLGGGVAPDGVRIDVLGPSANVPVSAGTLVRGADGVYRVQPSTSMVPAGGASATRVTFDANGNMRIPGDSQLATSILDDLRAGRTPTVQTPTGEVGIVPRGAQPAVVLLPGANGAPGQLLLTAPPRTLDGGGTFMDGLTPRTSATIDDLLGNPRGDLVPGQRPRTSALNGGAVTSVEGARVQAQQWIRATVQNPDAEMRVLATRENGTRLEGYIDEERGLAYVLRTSPKESAGYIDANGNPVAPHASFEVYRLKPDSQATSFESRYVRIENSHVDLASERLRSAVATPAQRLDAARVLLDAEGVRYTTTKITVRGQEVDALVLEPRSPTAFGRAAGGLDQHVGADLIYAPGANAIYGAHGFFSTSAERPRLGLGDEDILGGGIVSRTARHELEHALEERAIRLGGEPRRNPDGSVTYVPRGDIARIEAGSTPSPYGAQYSANEVSAFASTTRSDMLEARTILRRAEVEGRVLTAGEAADIDRLVTRSLETAVTTMRISEDVLARFTEARSVLAAPDAWQRVKLAEDNGVVWMSVPLGGNGWVRMPAQVPGGKDAIRALGPAGLMQAIDRQLQDGIARAYRAWEASQRYGAATSVLKDQGAFAAHDVQWQRRAEILAAFAHIGR